MWGGCWPGSSRSPCTESGPSGDAASRGPGAPGSAAGLRGGRSGPRVDAPVMRPGTVGIVERVIDAVDLAGLGPAGGRGQCEVRVAPRLAEDVELVIHPTPPSVGPRIVQGPVAVDETIGDRPVRWSRASSPWRLENRCLALQQGGTEILGGVVVVVQLQLDLAVSGPTKIRQGIDVLGVVFLDRIEVRVARRAAVAVAKPAEPLGIVCGPTARPGRGRRPQRLRLPGARSDRRRRSRHGSMCRGPAAIGGLGAGRE